MTTEKPSGSGTSGRSAYSRREALKLAAGAAAGAAAASIGTPLFAQQKEVSIFTWETYHEPDWVRAFTDSTGINVNVTNTGSADELFAQTRSGSVKADVIYVDSGSIQRYKDAGLIQPLDVSRLKNVGNITGSMPWQAMNTIDGQLWGGVPYNWGTQPLMYDSSVVTEAPTSWGILWDKQYEGRVGLFDDAYVTIPMIAMYIQATDPFNLTEEEFEEVRTALRLLRGQVRTIARGFDDAANLYAAGDTVVGYCQNIAVVTQLNELGKPFRYSLPVEGTPSWVDNACLSTAGDRDEVYQFIDYTMTPEWQAKFIQFSANNGILSLESARAAGIPDDFLAKTHIIDQESDTFWKSVRFFQPVEDFDRRLALWNDFKAGTL